MPCPELYQYRGILVLIDSQATWEKCLLEWSRDRPLRICLRDGRTWTSSTAASREAIRDNGYVARLALRNQLDVPVVKSIRDYWMSKFPSLVAPMEEFLQNSHKDSPMTDKGFQMLLFSAMDSSKRNSIRFEDYIQTMSILSHSNDQARLKLIFRALDQDGDGVVSQSDYRTAVLRLQELCPESPFASRFIE